MTTIIFSNEAGVSNITKQKWVKAVDVASLSNPRINAMPLVPIKMPVSLSALSHSGSAHKFGSLCPPL